MSKVDRETTSRPNQDAATLAASGMSIQRELLVEHTTSLTFPSPAT